MIDCVIFKEADFEFSTVLLKNVGLCLLSSLECSSSSGYFYNLQSNNLDFFQKDLGIFEQVYEHAESDPAVTSQISGLWIL